MEETYSLGRTDGSQRRFLILVKKKIKEKVTTIKLALRKVRLRQEEQELKRHRLPARKVYSR